MKEENKLAFIQAVIENMTAMNVNLTVHVPINILGSLEKLIMGVRTVQKVEIRKDDIYVTNTCPLRRDWC